jgi:putative membrane protein
MDIELKNDDRKMLTVIGVLSVAIPLVVAFLLFMPQTGKLGDLNVSFLPHLNAVLNSSTALALLTGFVAVRNKNVYLHRTMMMAAFVLSSLFLVSYVLYHFQSEQLYFGDANNDKILDEAEKLAVSGTRPVYLFVLLTHIVLSVAVVPLVLLALYFAFSKQIERHKKIVKWTFPVWLYVAVSGVTVYLMMTPYYQ